MIASRVLSYTSPAACRAFTATAGVAAGTFKLPDLPYDYAALEPVISGKIMELHHGKHHNAYVTNLNIQLEKFAEAQRKGDLTTMISLEPLITFNGGGHLNHTIFWSNLGPKSTRGEYGGGQLSSFIEKQWGTYSNFVTKFNAATLAIRGSGWGWLGYNKTNKLLEIKTMANQDPLEAATGLVPILGIDVWEHAYYLDYKNDRAAFLKEIWNVVNWRDLEKRLQQAKLGE